LRRDVVQRSRYAACTDAIVSPGHSVNEPSTVAAVPISSGLVLGQIIE
jgi:hypothetical protein